MNSQAKGVRGQCSVTDHNSLRMSGGWYRQVHGRHALLSERGDMYSGHHTGSTAAVHGHGTRHRLERDALETRAHARAIDRDARLSDVASDARRALSAPQPRGVARFRMRLTGLSGRRRDLRR